MTPIQAYRGYPAPPGGPRGSSPRLRLAPNPGRALRRLGADLPLPASAPCLPLAEGDKQSQILRAEGERQAAILRAEGFSQALERIFSAARGIDDKTITLQYFDALKQLGASSATKFVIPMEFTELARHVRDFATGSNGEGPREAPPVEQRVRPIPSAPPAPGSPSA